MKQVGFRLNIQKVDSYFLSCWARRFKPMLSPLGLWWAKDIKRLFPIKAWICFILGCKLSTTCRLGRTDAGVLSKNVFKNHVRSCWLRMLSLNLGFQNPAKYCPCSLSVKLPVHRSLPGIPRQWVQTRTGVGQCEVPAQRWSFNPGFHSWLCRRPMQDFVYAWGGCRMPWVGVQRKRTSTRATQNGAIKLYIGPVHIWALQQPRPVLPAKSQNLVEWIVQDLFERNLIKQKINTSNYTINKHHLMVTSSNYTVPKNFTLPLQLALRIGIRDFGKTIAITGQHRGWLRRGYPFWESIRSNRREDSVERCFKQNCGRVQSAVHQQETSHRESTTLPHSKPAAWPGTSPKSRCLNLFDHCLIIF